MNWIMMLIVRVEEFIVTLTLPQTLSQGFAAVS